MTLRFTRMAAAALLASQLGACGSDAVMAPKAQPVELQELSPGRYQVPKAWVVDTKNPWFGKRAKSAFTVVDDGNLRGVRLAGFEQGSRTHKMGLVEGDVLRAVNGKPVVNVPQALKALGMIGQAETATLELTRRGEPLTLIYEIK